jgi:lysophospholipase L1-like esterase
VKFKLNGGEHQQVILLPPDGIIYSDTFKATFNGLSPIDGYTIEAFIVDDFGNEVVGENCYDSVSNIGLGDYYVSFGDSITAGEGDDDPLDDLSSDSRNFSPGYSPILNDLLSDPNAKGYPNYIANEGLGGETSAGGLVRLPRVLMRHPNSQYFLIQYGTNDGGGLFPIPSGKNDLEYPGSFKDNMQQMIDMITAEGKSAYLAKAPFSLYPSLNQQIVDYNIVVDQLIDENNILLFDPPDFYSFFEENQDQISDDNIHPTGAGYKSMANLWSYSLLNLTPP